MNNVELTGYKSVGSQFDLTPNKRVTFSLTDTKLSNLGRVVRMTQLVLVLTLVVWITCSVGYIAKY